MLETMQHKTSGEELLEKFIESAPAQAASALENMPLSEAVFWMTSLRAQSLVLCFEQMNPKKAAPLLRRLPIKQAVFIISRLNAQCAAQMMLNLPAPYKERLTAALEPEMAKTLSEVLSYPQGSAARLMQNNFTVFKTDTKVKDILARIKTVKNRIPYCVYIVDKTGRAAGCIKTAELAFCNEESVAGSVMSPDFEKLSPFDSQSKVLSLFKLSNALILPVIDAEGYLLGVINASRLMDGPQKPQANISAAQKNTFELPAKYNMLIALGGAVLLLLFVLFKYLS